MSEARRPRVLFVTGKLAEPALRRVLADLAPKAGFDAEVIVLPITVAALMTANWVARHLSAPEGVDRVILPGFCRGDVDEVSKAANAPAEKRQELYTKVQQVLAEELPVLWLLELDFPTVSRCNVKGLTTTAIGINDAARNTWKQ